MLNLKPGEWPRVLILFLMFGLINLGIVWGNSIVYAAFLEQGGLSGLPWIFIVSALLSIAAMSIYTPFTDRVPDDKLLNIIFLVEIGGILVGLALLQFSRAEIAFSFLYVIGLAWLAVVNPQLITYVNSFYDIQTAKRIMPVVTAGYRAGAILGGLTMPALVFWFHNPQVIIMGWLAAHLAVVGLIWLMARQLPPPINSHRATKTENQGLATYHRNIIAGIKYIDQSIYLRWMVAGTLMLAILMPLLEYQASDYFLRIYGTNSDPTGSIANVVGYLRGVGNVIVLPMLLFGVSRIITRLGVTNASLIFPVGNLIVVAGVLSAGNVNQETALFIAAGAAYLDRNVFRLTFWYPVEGLLYNAVPLHVKGRARAVVSGFINPVGVLLAGFMLLIPAVNTTWFVPALLLALAIAFLLSILAVRRAYGRALVDMLAQEDYSFLLTQQAAETTITDPAVLDSLSQRLQTQIEADPSLAIFTAELMAQLGGERAAPALVKAAQIAPPNVRAAILNTLSTADLHTKGLLALYQHNQQDHNPAIRQAALNALYHWHGSTATETVSLALSALNDPVADIRQAAFIALAGSGYFYQQATAVTALNKQLAPDASVETQIGGLRTLGFIDDPRARQTLIDLLGNARRATDNEFRTEAMLALHRQVTNYHNDGTDLALLVDTAGSALQDPIERIRRLATDILGSLATKNAYHRLFTALADPSPNVRIAAAQYLTQTGKSMVPLLEEALENRGQRQMAAVVLSNLGSQQYAHHLQTEIDRHLQDIYRHHGYLHVLTPYKGFTGVELLKDHLIEANRLALDEIFYLLSVRHGQDALQLVNDALTSGDSHAHNNAVEALESFTDPQTATLIGKLCRPNLDLARMVRTGETVWHLTPPNPDTMIQAFAMDQAEHWRRAITLYAISEVGVAIWPPAANPAPAPTSEPPRRKRRDRSRRSRTDLFAALDETPSPDNETPTQQPPKRRPRSRSRRNPADLLAGLDGPTETAPPSPVVAGTPTAATDTAGAPPPFKSKTEIETLLIDAGKDDNPIVRDAARAALSLLSNGPAQYQSQEKLMLSTIEKIIFLKRVDFFKEMNTEQLTALAAVCEELFVAANETIFSEGDTGGVLYVIVSGKVGVEQAGRRKGSSVRLATLGPSTYFGEMSLFDESTRSASALALQDVVLLRLRKEPLIALVRQQPDLALKLINVLSFRLRDSNQQIVALSRSKPRQLHQLYDSLD